MFFSLSLLFRGYAVDFSYEQPDFRQIFVHTNGIRVGRKKSNQASHAGIHTQRRYVAKDKKRKKSTLHFG